ncbi:MAG: cardiolipin synthase, partial [Bacteroidales bacterium]|nr:cardiolipin synthase [Bacteroidales bacterium]
SSDYKIKSDLSKKQLEEFRKEPWKLDGLLHPYSKLIFQNMLCSHTLLERNSDITFYFTGREALDAMFEEMEKARHHIHLQSYIILSDKTGERLKKLLIKKAGEGVNVKVMYDDIGSFSLKKSYVKELAAAGIEVIRFAPIRLVTPASKLNYRNHRKILIVDGITAFLGGVNIADRYYYGISSGDWYDTHVRIRGNSVYSIQASFLMDRNFAMDRKFRFSRKYYPKININLSSGNDRLQEHQIYTQIISSGPDSDWAGIMGCYFGAITAAEKHIYIMTPYFAPNPTILNSLKTVALGNVDVKILLPEKSDSRVAQWSSMSYVSELLEAGIKIYLFGKGFNHAKVISIDGKMCMVGSANFDNRSFEHNFEIMSAIYDEERTSVIESHFSDMLNSSTCLSLLKWEKRSRKEKIAESLSRLWSPLL